MKRNFQTSTTPSPSANVSRFSAGIASVLLLTTAVTSAAAQTPAKSKVQQEIEKKNTPEVKRTAPPAAPRNLRVKPSNFSPRRRGAASSYAGPRRRSSPAPNEFSVTFTTDVAGADIALNGVKVGTTGDDKKLSATVKIGNYKATASRAGYNTQAAMVAIKSDGETFPFFFGKPIAEAPAPAAATVAEVRPTPQPTRPPPSADEIIRRFGDPAEAENITLEEWREVVAQSEQSLAQEPTNAQHKARLHLGRGQIAFIGKDYAEALIQFTNATRELPRSGLAYYGLGNAYLATNQPAEAAKAYQRAIQLTPDIAAKAYKASGDAMSKLGKNKDANEQYVRARKLGYFSAEMSKNVALNLMREKQWKQAIVELNAVVEKHPSADLYVIIGECHENLKQPLSAYRAYATATKIDPSSAVAHAKLGDLLYAQKEYDEAKEAYERALALDTTGAQINRQQTRKQADAAASLGK